MDQAETDLAPGQAAELPRTMPRIRRFEETRAALLKCGELPRLRPSLHRRGGGRGRLCDGARKTRGAAREIVAGVAESAWASLKSAPRAVAWEDVPMPFSPMLERRVLVDEGKIRAAVLATLKS
ncbi:MAG: hypothetical protein ACREGL_06450 [Alphaproteobacteria bacterium]